MITIKEILETIDTSKMVDDAPFYDMCDKEFRLYEYISQNSDNIRLKSCPYHTWVCTDTRVGIEVLYFDGKPVCITSQPYRKSDTTYHWLSKKDFNNVKEYAFSLIEEEDYDIKIVTDESIDKIVDFFETIDYKAFENKNVLQ